MKSLSIDEQGHTRLYKCDSEGKSNLTFDENDNRVGRGESGLVAFGLTAAKSPALGAPREHRDCRRNH